MITKIERFSFEALDDYIAKLCLLNCCSSLTLFNPIIKYRNYTEHTIFEYLFSYENELTIKELNQVIDENVLSEIKINVEELLGPFSVYLSKNLKYLYDKNFKYCPKCMEEGNHYLFHQFTFLDKCLIHELQLSDRCPFCGNHYSLSIHFTKNGIYNCPICKKSLFDYYSNITVFNIIKKSFHRKSVKFDFPNNSEKSCLIIDINSRQGRTSVNLPYKAKLFLGEYLIYGKQKEPDIIVKKNKCYTNFKVQDLYYYFQTCSYITEIKDFTQIDLSAIVTLEDALCDVIKKIQSTYKVAFKWPNQGNNINRTTVNLRKEISNWLIHTLLNDKKETSKQYAFYLWLLSNIFRDQSGKNYNSTLPAHYLNLLYLLNESFSTKDNNIYFQSDTIDIAYNINKYLLYKQFLQLLSIIEYKHEDGSFISDITEQVIKIIEVPFATPFKAFIFEKKNTYDIYIFETDEVTKHENFLLLSENADRIIGGYDLIKRSDFKME